jgi:hypothetical protein
VTTSPYSQPVLLTTQGDAVPLARVSFEQSSGAGALTEDWLQVQLFRYPLLLPIEDIDPAYRRLLPVCRELSTPAGPIDILYVTPQGRLVVVETKLWRNPEARRKVVAQVLDYAKELAQWEYEDLMREVLRATGEKGDALLERARQADPDLDEARFIDNVSRTLRTGRFLLLIVGDGIREGVGALTEFLDRYGSLDFTFGLVEIAVFDVPGAGRLLHPRVLAKTLTIRRSVVILEPPGVRLQHEGEPPEQSGEADPEAARRQAFYEGFWTRFVAELKLDDLSQPPARPTRTENIFFPMPPSSSEAWLSAYFAQSRNQVGVYLRFLKDSAFGKSAYESLLAERDAIEQELGFAPEWSAKDGRFSVAIRRSYADLDSAASQREIAAFFAGHLNRFVNAFRPRLERMARGLGEG